MVRLLFPSFYFLLHLGTSKILYPRALIKGTLIIIIWSRPAGIAFLPTVFRLVLYPLHVKEIFC